MVTSARPYGSQGTAVWPQEPQTPEGTYGLFFLLGCFPIVEEAQVASTEGMFLALYQALMVSLSFYTPQWPESSWLWLLPLCPFPCSLAGSSVHPPLPQHFSTDPVAASIMKIHTFNRDRDRVKLGVDTIAK